MVIIYGSVVFFLLIWYGLCGAIFYIHFNYKKKFKNCTVKTIGKVTDILHVEGRSVELGHGSHSLIRHTKTIYHYPIVEYVVVDGSVHRVKTVYGYGGQSFDIGKEYEILYNPNNLNEACFAVEQRPPYIAIILSIVPPLIVIYFYVIVHLLL